MATGGLGICAAVDAAVLCVPAQHDQVKVLVGAPLVHPAPRVEVYDPKPKTTVTGLFVKQIE